MKISISLVLLVMSVTNASAWDFNGDPEGQKLDTEARHVLTTQNVCGVVIRAEYLKALYAKINRHFAPDLEYPLYLRRSVLSANSEYLMNAEASDIAKECKTRIQALRQQQLIIE